MLMVPVSRVMTDDVLAAAPDTSLQTIARLFAVRNISGVPVIDDSGRLLGMVTQKDIVDPDRDRSAGPAHPVFYRIQHGHLIEEGEAGSEAEGRAEDVMTPFAFTVSPDTPLIDAIRIMASDDVHRVVVLDGSRVVGILTTMDVLRALASEKGEPPPAPPF